MLIVLVHLLLMLQIVLKKLQKLLVSKKPTQYEDSGAEAKLESLSFLAAVDVAVNFVYRFAIFSSLAFNKKGYPFLFGILYCYFQTQIAEHF